MVIEFLINVFAIISSPFFIFLLFLIVLGYHIIALVVRDLNYLTQLKEFDDSEIVTFEQLKKTPVVNFIIPAWKEGKLFQECLLSILNLTYPYLRVIVNAGGSEETKVIAESFKKYNNFIVLEQKGGGGKIRAINDCLAYVSEGLVYLIDADSYITNEIFLKMISLIVNQNKNIIITSTRPLKQQEKLSLVNYLNIDRNPRFRKRFKPKSKRISPHTCLRYDVLKEIGKFPQGELIGDGWVGVKLSEKGFDIYELENYRWRIFTFFPDKIKTYMSQNKRWIQNPLFNKLKGKTKTRYLKFTLMTILSIYILICPTFLLFNFFLFILGVIGLFSLYLKKIRKVIFFLISIKKEFRNKISISLYLKIIFYIYIEAIITIEVFFEILIYKDKKYRKRKNIL
ncbi:MAG: glycosyltransferase [Candidatus Hodarchaeota archaeon]